MSTRRLVHRSGAVLILAFVSLTACSSSSTSKHAGTTVSSTPPSASPGTSIASAEPTPCTTATTSAAGGSAKGDTAPPGDIPDSQAFVVFTPAPATYSIKVPEGWARTDAQDRVSFTDKFNTITVQVVPASSAPTPQSAQSAEVPQLAASARCFTPGHVTATTRKGGGAILVTYQMDSAPDAVTGKVVRDDVERYEFWRNGSEAVVTLSAPVGSDNVDAWRLVTDSFAWK